MADENMKKALQSRRGRSVDISVILDPHQGAKYDGAGGKIDGHTDKDYEDSKKSDLAPAPDHPLDVDHAAGVPAPDHPSMHSPLSEMKDSDLLNGMSEYDMGDAATRSPRSLVERARKEAILKATAAKK